MGQMPGEMTKMAGDYLLSILVEEITVPYSRFYDGSDETREKLRIGIGMSESDADWYSIELMMDLAADRFAKMGIVEIRPREDKLADGEKNYDIVLTEKGCQFIADAKEYKFPDLDL